MKKKFLLSILLVATLVVTGCGAKEEAKTLNCSLKGTVIEGVETSSNYKVTYKGDYVQVIETEEVVTSDDSEYLELVKQTVEKMYSPYKNVEHYNYDVKVSGNTLTSITKIDYNKIDTNKMLEINSAIGTLMEDGKLKVSDVEALYKQMGITCK